MKMKGSQVHRFVFVCLLLLVVVAQFGVGVAVAEQEKEDEDSDSGVLDAISEFTDNWSGTLREVLVGVFFTPWQKFAGALLSAVTQVLTSTPSVHPNPAVEDVHSDVLFVTYLLSTLVFVVAGILYMIGPILGVTYGEVRQILPRVLIALIFAAFSLPLLQLAVDLTDALVYAFRPELFELRFQQIAGINVGLVIAWIVKSVLLLIVAVIFIIRDVYILFVAAISPLLALAWSLPRAKRYADTFIAGWFAALMIAPLAMLVLKFSFALMTGAGGDTLQGVSNWIIGIASLFLLILVPYQVWNASQVAVGAAYSASNGVKDRLHDDDYSGSELTKEEAQRLQRNRKRRAMSNNQDYPWRD